MKVRKVNILPNFIKKVRNSFKNSGILQILNLKSFVKKLYFEMTKVFHHLQVSPTKYNAYSIFLGKGIDLCKSVLQGIDLKVSKKGEKQFHFCSLTSSDLSLLPIDVAQSVSPVHGQKNVKLATRPNLHNPTKWDPLLFC